MFIWEVREGGSKNPWGALVKRGWNQDPFSWFWAEWARTELEKPLFPRDILSWLTLQATTPWRLSP